jgi:hypothetical protein
MSSTETIVISQTATQPSRTPTFVPTLTPTYTYTLFPTLSSGDAHTRLRALLGDSTSCPLPCWLGVIPGQSTWQEANDQLKLFSGISDGLFIETGADKWSTEFLKIPNLTNTIVIEVRISYPTSSTDNVVSIVSAESRAYRQQDGHYEGDVYGYSAYNELLKPYSIASVLTNYGNPQNIYIFGFLRDDVAVTPGFGDHFVIHLWYPNQGIFMAYQMAVERSGTNYRFCPSNALISGYLMTPGLGSKYKDILLSLNSTLYQYFFPPSTKYINTPQEAFGMTDEEFIQLFRSPTDRCLETPISLWWPK